MLLSALTKSPPKEKLGSVKVVLVLRLFQSLFHVIFIPLLNVCFLPEPVRLGTISHRNISHPHNGTDSLYFSAYLFKPLTSSTFDARRVSGSVRRGRTSLLRFWDLAAAHFPRRGERARMAAPGLWAFSPILWGCWVASLQKSFHLPPQQWPVEKADQIWMDEYAVL